MTAQSSDDAGVLATIRRRFAEVERLAHLGSWEWDVLADRITWSDELYRIYGLEPQEFEATYEAFLERIHPDDVEMVDATVNTAYAQRHPFAFDHRLVRPDGSIRWLHGRGKVETDEEENVVRLFGIAVDVTEQKRTEQFLRDFIANAAHDLRTPITAISQAARFLRAQGADAAAKDRALEILERRVAGLAELSQQLLDLSSLESGATTTVLSPVLLDKAVSAAREVVPPRAGAELVLGIARNLWVVAEPSGLQRVFQNLLSNAFAHGGTHVTVTADRERDEVQVVVADDGPGVNPDIEHDLFAPFVVGSTTGTGSGLGLAIVDRLMRAFGGRIEYRRRRPTGSEFVLRFEAADADAPDR